MKLLSIFLCFIILLTPSLAYGESPQGRITKIPWAGTLISDVDPNIKHKVPFPGVLLDSKAWATIQSQKDAHNKMLELKDLEKIRTELKKQKEIDALKIELKWTIQTYKERLDIRDKYTKRLEEMIKDDAGDTNWVPWAFVGGVVVGAVAAVAIAFAVNESK